MGVGESKHLNSANAASHDLEEIRPEDEAWQQVSKLLQERTEPHRKHYGFSLKVKKLWGVRQRVGSLQKNEAEAMQLGQPTQLFHGTSIEKACNIVTGGFQLPKKAGMFGRGVYFADCPLKSANFAPDQDAGSWHRFFNDGLTAALMGPKKQGQLLLCDVYLGRSKTLRHAAPTFNPAEDLKPSWWEQRLQAFGFMAEGDYDSAFVPGGWFGAVNVAEYVVYQAFQGVPKYVIEFDYGR